MEAQKLKNTFKKSNILYVFRHGETDWNKEGRLQGHLEIPITETGERQTESIASILENKGVEILLSSDLKRAKRTSEIVSKILGLNPIFDSNFREVFLGEGQGKLISEVDFYFGKSFWERWNNHDPAYDELHFPNGESKREMDYRIHHSLLRITELFSGRVIALCTHGFVMTRMLKMYKNLSQNSDRPLQLDLSDKAENSTHSLPKGRSAGFETRRKLIKQKISNIQNGECIKFHSEEILSREKIVDSKNNLEPVSKP